MNSVGDNAGVGVSRALAGHVADIRYAKLPAAVVHAFRRAYIDFLTCAIAGSSMPVSCALMNYFGGSDATRIASVIGNPLKLSAPNAAFVTGANVHGLDFDDGYTQGSCHPAGAVFPAVMAAAQQHGASDSDIVTAAVAGYDVMCRIAAAMHPASAKRGFHNTALAGVFGAAAAVARLLELNVEQTLNALGLAGSFSAGIREYLDEGADIKRIHPGKAARDGVVCAELAARGITGPSKVLEGRYGFFATHVNLAAGDVKWDRLIDGLGEQYNIAGAYFKPYPCCRHYQAAIDGIKALQRAHRFKPQDVAKTEIGLYAVGVNGHDHKHVDSLLDAQMSAPCAAALTLVCGDVTAQTFLPETLRRTDVQAMLQRCDAFLDDECERIYPGTRSGFVRITLNDGQRLEERVVSPKGEAENPMTDTDLETKFMGNCEKVVGRMRADALLAQAWRMGMGADLDMFYRWN